MPTENENKVDSLIDVGEADEKATEINLDEKGEVEKVETPAEEKIEVEQVPEDKSFENERETKLEKKEDSDELKEYSDGVQKRIAKLTRKMREAERQREEAVQYAQAAKQDKDRLESKLSTLDKSYVKEFESRVTTNMDAARQSLKVAIEAGAIGFGISGSGPSVYALANGIQETNSIADAMSNIINQVGIDFEIHISAINNQGIKVISCK